MDPVESPLHKEEQLHPLDSAYREGERKRIRDELESSYRDDFKGVDWGDENSLLSEASMRRARDFVAEMVNENLSSTSSHHSRHRDPMDNSHSTHHSRRLETMIEAEEYLYNVNLMENPYGGSGSHEKKTRCCSSISGRIINCYYGMRERLVCLCGRTRRQRIMVLTTIFVVLPLIVIFAAVFATGSGSSSNGSAQENIYALPISSKPKNMQHQSLVWNEIVSEGITNGDDLDFEGSPTHVALRWITDYDVPSSRWIADGTFKTKNKQLLLERYALAVFFFSTHQVNTVNKDGDDDFVYIVPETEWNATDNWMSGDSVCSWYGLSCLSINETMQQENSTEEFHDQWLPVRIVNLAELGIPGTIPSELSALKSLNVLDLGNNDLGGTIPTSLGGLNELVALHLPTNYLNGTIPSQIGSLPELLSLSLGVNNLEGPVPSEITELPQLKTLDLHYNLLQGQLLRFTRLHELRYLVLDDNQFSGQLPDAIDLMPSLEHVSVSHNDLTGTIPKSIFSLDKLKILDLTNNNMVGPIPDMFAQVPLLEELELADNAFTSSIPPSIGELYNLKVLDVSNNGLDSGIPATFGGLHKLEHLVLLNNKLQSQIPAELSGLRTLQTLDLRRNQLFGDPPRNMTMLRNLRFLGLSHNNLTGPLLDLEEFHLLVELRLENNKFTSSIPSGIEHIVELKHLDLSNNYLNSTIPEDVFHLLFLETLLLGGNHFTGTVPDMFDRLRDLKEIQLSNNQFVSSLPHSVAKLRSLESLYLDGNQFESTIPPLYGEISSLQQMNLATNQLSGSLPLALGNLVSLNELRIHENKLTGSVPSKFGELLELHDFTFYNNDLSGAVPAEVCYLRTEHQLTYIAADCSNNGKIECDCCHECYPLPEGLGDGV